MSKKSKSVMVCEQPEPFVGGSIPEIIRRSEANQSLKSMIEKRREQAEAKFNINFDWFVERHIEVLKAFGVHQVEHGIIDRGAIAWMKSLGVAMGYYPEKIEGNDLSNEERENQFYDELKGEIQRLLPTHKKEY